MLFGIEIKIIITKKSSKEIEIKVKDKKDK